MADDAVVAVLGAGDLAGEETLRLLAASSLPVAAVRALDVGAAVGQPVDYGETALLIEDPAVSGFAGVQLVLACCDRATAERHLPAARAAHCTVVDSSGYVEESREAPLVDGHYNLQALARVRAGDAIATPDYATLQLLRLLAPLQANFGLVRAALTICHPAAYGGRDAVESLARHSAAALNGQGLHVHAGTRPFSLVAAHAGPGVSGSRVIGRLQRLLGDAALKLTLAEMLAPVFFDCTLVVHAETVEAVDGAVLAGLYGQEGLHLQGAAVVRTEREDDTESAVAPCIQWLHCAAEGAGGVVSLCASADAVRSGVAANHARIAARLLEVL